MARFLAINMPIPKRLPKKQQPQETIPLPQELLTALKAENRPEQILQVGSPIIGGINIIRVYKDIAEGKKWSYITPAEFKDEETGRIVAVRAGESIFDNPAGVLGALKQATAALPQGSVNWRHYAATEHYDGQKEFAERLSTVKGANPLRIIYAQTGENPCMIREFIDGKTLRQCVEKGDYDFVMPELEVVLRAHRPKEEGGIEHTIGDRTGANTVIEHHPRRPRRLHVLDHDIDLRDNYEFELSQLAFYLNWAAKDRGIVAPMIAEAFAKNVKGNERYDPVKVGHSLLRYIWVCSPNNPEGIFSRMEQIPGAGHTADNKEYLEHVKKPKYEQHVHEIKTIIIPSLF